MPYIQESPLLCRYTAIHTKFNTAEYNAQRLQELRIPNMEPAQIVLNDVIPMEAELVVHAAHNEQHEEEPNTNPQIVLDGNGPEPELAVHADEQHEEEPNIHPQIVLGGDSPEPALVVHANQNERHDALHVVVGDTGYINVNEIKEEFDLDEVDNAMFEQLIIDVDDGARKAGLVVQMIRWKQNKKTWKTIWL